MKNNKNRDDGDKRKQLYTWVGCGLVVVLTLVAVVPNLGDDGKPDYSKFASSRMQDLAAMPFGTDAEAGNFLRNNPEYQDASNADLLGSLFSSDDRKARQAADKANGAPPPPDPEYKAIADQNKRVEKAQKVVTERANKRKKDTQDYNARKEKMKARQSQGGKTLSGGNRVGQGSASSGVTGSIWGYQGKNISGQSMSSAHTATAGDYNSAKKYGRNVGVYQAALESKKAGDAQDADTAAASAIDAFQKGLTDEEIAKDEEETGLDNEGPGIDEDFRDDLTHDLNDDLDNGNDGGGDDGGGGDGNNDYTINDNCLDSKGEVVWKCMLTKGISEGLNLLTGYLSWGMQGGWSEGKRNKQTQKWLNEAHDSCSSAPTGSQCTQFWNYVTHNSGNNGGGGVFEKGGKHYIKYNNNNICLDC